MNKTFLSLIIVALILGGLFGAKKMHAPKKPPASTAERWAAQGIPVEVGTITRGDMKQTVEVTGDINALTKVTLSSKIPGRVLSVLKREGDTVASGSAVIVLDQEDARSNLLQAQAALQSAQIRLSQAMTNAKVTKIQTDATIEQAKAGLDSAKARLSVVKKPARSQDMLVAENNVASAKARLDAALADFKRGQQLLKDGAISASTFDVVNAQYITADTTFKSAKEQLSLFKEGGRSEDIRSAQAQVDTAKEQLRSARANASQNLLRAEDIKQAKAAVEQAKAQLALAQQQVSYTTIKSPISGDISSRSTEPGQVVSPGQPLADVVDLGSVYLKGDISETQLDQVRQGQSVAVGVDALRSRTFQGVVEKIYPAGSTQSRNFFVRIKITSGSRMVKPGMFARGLITTGLDRNVLLVSKDAVEERGGTKMVFIVGPKNIVRRHQVEVVRENQAYAELLVGDGINDGDKVVTRGHQNLQDKSLVQIEK